MWREMENYICNSEDRPHYDTDRFYPWHCAPMRTPEVTVINQIVETKIIKETISEEELTEIIDARLPQITQRVTEEVSTNILPEINEIDGGSASDALLDDEGDG